MKARAYCSVLLAVFAATACQPNDAALVTVHYQQVANFRGYQVDPKSEYIDQAGEGMFVMYRVSKIVNTGTQAAPFVFTPSKVVTITNDKTSNNTVDPSHSETLLNNLNLATVSVGPAGTLMVGRCFIKRVLTSHPDSMGPAGTRVPLSYQTNQSQPVMMQYPAPPPGNIAFVSYYLPTPSSLQKLCQP